MIIGEQVFQKDTTLKRQTSRTSRFPECKRTGVKQVKQNGGVANKSQETGSELKQETKQNNKEEIRKNKNENLRY